MSQEDFIVDGRALGDLRVVDLKEQLEKRGLSKSGSKQVLMNRLRDHLMTEQQQQEPAKKDSGSAPNVEMKSLGNSMVAEYLARQQQALQEAQKATVRGATASESAESLSDDANQSASASSQESDGGDKSSPKRRGRKKQSPVRKSPEPPRPVDGPQSPPQETKQQGVPTEAKPSLASPSRQEKQREMERQRELELEKQRAREEEAKEKEEQEKRAREEQAKKAKEEQEKKAREEQAKKEREKKEKEEQEKREKERKEREEREKKEKERKEKEEHEKREKEKAREKERKEKEEREKKEREDRAKKEKAKEREKEKHSSENGSSSPKDDIEMEISAAPNEVLEGLEESQPRAAAPPPRPEPEPQRTVTVEERQERGERKRKWGSTKAQQRTTVSISSDSLKEIVGAVPPSEFKEEMKVEVDYDTPEPKRIVISKDDLEEESSRDSASQHAKSENHAAPMEEGKPASAEATTTEEGLIRKKSASPARHPVSRILHVRCLTRPFTVRALQDLLGKFGRLVKEEFWIDNIKSHCMAKFETDEEAVTARSQLHNVQWPSSNPKMLRVEFATQEELDKYRGVAVEQRSEAAEGDQQHQKEEKADGKENSTAASAEKKRDVREERGRDSRASPKDEKRDAGDKDRQKRRRSRSADKEGDKSVWPKDREWDRGKNWGAGQSPPREDRRRSRRSPTPQRRPDEPRKEEPPAKLLDDLFRKTKATPCIYWLPLTEDQIKQREAERLQREKDREERRRAMEEEERNRKREREKERSERRGRSPSPERQRRR